MCRWKRELDEISTGKLLSIEDTRELTRFLSLLLQHVISISPLYELKWVAVLLLHPRTHTWSLFYFCLFKNICVTKRYASLTFVLYLFLEQRILIVYGADLACWQGHRLVYNICCWFLTLLRMCWEMFMNTINSPLLFVLSNNWIDGCESANVVRVLKWEVNVVKVLERSIKHGRESKV